MYETSPDCCIADPAMLDMSVVLANVAIDALLEVKERMSPARRQAGRHELDDEFSIELRSHEDAIREHMRFVHMLHQIASRRLERLRNIATTIDREAARVKGDGARAHLEAAARVAHEDASRLASRMNILTDVLARMRCLVDQRSVSPIPPGEVPTVVPQRPVSPAPRIARPTSIGSDLGDVLGLAMKYAERRFMSPVVPPPPMPNYGGIFGLPPVTSWTVPGPAFEGRGFGAPGPRMW